MVKVIATFKFFHLGNILCSQMTTMRFRYIRYCIFWYDWSFKGISLPTSKPSMHYSLFCDLSLVETEKRMCVCVCVKKGVQLDIYDHSPTYMPQCHCIHRMFLKLPNLVNIIWVCEKTHLYAPDFCFKISIILINTQLQNTMKHW